MNGLELDKRFDQSVVQPVAEEEHKYPYHLPDGLQVSYEYAQKPSFSKARRVCWLRPATFILSVRALFGYAPCNCSSRCGRLVGCE